MSSAIVKFGDYSLEALDEESKYFGKTKFFKAAVGRNRVRFLPPAVGEKSPFKIVQQHKIEIIGKQYPEKVLCPGTGCPICKRVLELERTGLPADKEAAYQMSVQPRVFAAIIDRKEPESGPLVWEFGKKIYQDLSKLRQNEDAGGNFSHPYEGFDVFIERTGEGLKTCYTVQAARNTSPLADDAETMQAWMDARPNVTAFVKARSIDQLRAMMAGEAVDDEDEDLPPQRTAKVLGGTKKKQRTVEDDVMDAEFSEEK